ncbi:hypothetical protein UFOVP239_23 [uncultured Caudovirales phage]|uniref:Recombination endonuclease VII n=1 Tax=uncultured Caudovirales phage TaxID=2100421 RepID=A0A6J7WQ08_9CAUD|nr:hypothetical protein UFOVP239_23 [uncultured Caudovirales phage]
MNSKMNSHERKWVGLVKEQPCSVCAAPGPSDAHHIKQSRHYTVVALCKSCHQGSKMGWHGQKVAWAIAKMEELDALDVTLKNVLMQII